MINRVLIRIKVVQMLYSYLLVETQFSLLSQPSGPTKEKRFAYSLYLDTLLLVVKIAESITKRGGERPLYETRFISRVLADDKMKSLKNKYLTEDFPLGSVVNSLADEIKESGIYKNFLKNREDPACENKIWKELFDHIIAKNPGYNEVVSRRATYTMRGVERMKAMIEETFTDFFAAADHLPEALAVLDTSMHKARELYFRLLKLPVELCELRDRQIDDARHKFVKTEEDINPNMRFVENEFVKALAENPEFHAALEEYPVSWATEDPTLLRSLLKDIMESEIYADYMSFPATDFSNDCEFWREIYKNIIFRNPNFLEALEDSSVFWNDDLDVIGTFVLKTVRRFMESRCNSRMDMMADGMQAPMTDERGCELILPMYKDEEDAAFAEQLFSTVIRKKDAYRLLINESIEGRGWEYDRLAFMDVVVVMTALAEILNFPKIPLNVSFNEYIEIAKCYSSSKSGQFVNGLLGSLVTRLREEGALMGK